MYPEFKTDLGEYILWYDGFVEIDPSRLEDLFLKGVDPRRIAVSEINQDVQKYNKLAKNKIQLKNEIDVDLINFNWNIPREYLEIDVKKYILALTVSKLTWYSGQDLKIRYDRITQELKEYTDRNLLDVLRVLIYVVDMFKKNKVVWGVGRGSSCASYILFLLEVHSVDSVKYEIPLEEFFK